MEKVDVEYIPWALEHGHTVRQIAEHLDRSCWTIQRYARGYGQRPPGRPRKFTAAQLVKVKAMVPVIGYARTARAIGEALQTVRHAARRMGVESPFKRCGRYGR